MCVSVRNKNKKKRNLQQHPRVQTALKVCVYVGSGVGARGCLGITWCNCRVSSRGVTARLAADAPTGRQVGTHDNRWAACSQNVIISGCCRFCVTCSCSSTGAVLLCHTSALSFPLGVPTHQFCQVNLYKKERKKSTPLE